MSPLKAALRHMIAQLDAATSDEQKVMALQMTLMQLSQVGDAGLNAAVSDVEQKMAAAFLGIVPQLRDALFEYEAKIP